MIGGVGAEAIQLQLAQLQTYPQYWIILHIKLRNNQSND
jgi:hypothetical protein